MIKRVIFDLDNTVIPFKEEYWNTVKETFEEENILYTNQTLIQFREIIGTYEDNYPMYNKETMRKHLEKHLHIHLTETFIDTWICNLKKCVPDNIDNKTIEILEYLSKKYELLILTNWFTEQQKERIERAGLGIILKK
jgi:FMN phosphatase YigB (HAD superfamily)